MTDKKKHYVDNDKFFIEIRELQSLPNKVKLFQIIIE